MKKTAKQKPTREQLAALAHRLADAPVINPNNDAQNRAWDEIGGSRGWAALDADAKASFRARMKSLA